MRHTLWHPAALFMFWTISWPAWARTLEFQTTQVTTADLALSPDGHTLLFTLLGHLFSSHSGGGAAKQLTFGPSYDSDPVFSPDGSQVAFTSDRDGSEGNVFVLTLEDRKVVQLTHEEHAGQPTWSPDGRSIVYLRYARGTVRSSPAVVSRISVQGGQPEILSSPPRRIGSNFYLARGQLAWSVIEQDTASSDYVTRVETLNSDGTVSTLRAIRGLVDRVSPNPRGEGLYCHRSIGADRMIPVSEDIVFVPLPLGAEKDMLPISSAGRFAASPDGKTLYVGDQGHYGEFSSRRAVAKPSTLSLP